MRRHLVMAALALGLVIVGLAAGARAVQAPAAAPITSSPSSYMSVSEEDFRTVFARMRAAKPEIEKRHQDTTEFFNLILGTQLTPNEKQDLVAFLRAL